jgi:hypothetical protein
VALLDASPEVAMNKALDYHARAIENEDLARHMSRQDHRDHFLQIAREWRRLALAAEEQEHHAAPAE